jgi:phage terminase Nu1 subunit (DNA packaging protein)
MKRREKMQSTKKRIVNTKEAAGYLKVSVALLERDRWRDGDIPFFKVGGSVKYDLDKLDEYMDQDSNEIRKERQVTEMNKPNQLEGQSEGRWD